MITTIFPTCSKPAITSLLTVQNYKTDKQFKSSYTVHVTMSLPLRIQYTFHSYISTCKIRRTGQNTQKIPVIITTTTTTTTTPI